ncbi:hypothetical protein A7P95_10135 [Eikenella longinqua]|uniref:DUF4410 domain-containing protein n=1 Tax=Eikenella longinqua TaxID=1795827 RepID=A0A1A9RUT2_9NEIS|nr:hypothetical protein [Eikenella longinqua]OAM26063.1 hypothetical protein A7P95_10135 [Eikenella longinqua]
MLRRLTALLALSLAGQAYAATFIADSIPYAPDAKVADRISTECTDLGKTFSQEIISQAKAQGIELQAAPAGSLAEQPDRIDIQITDIRSYGSAFTGHYKSINLQLTRYQNGQPTASTKLSRRSLGGMGGMFKSSCSVLDRVTGTLSQDIAAWLKAPAAAAETPAGTEAASQAQ